MYLVYGVCEELSKKSTMNEYLKNLNRIEFVVTLACTGRCKHCQNGDPVHTSEHIDADAAVRAIHKAGADMGIRKRQVITNGYFSKRHDRIEEVVRCLEESGVNELLLSVDAFHQETIPLELVLDFAECAMRAGIPIELSPAWLVSLEDENPYNLRTKEIMEAFAPLQIPVGQGNVIFPSGNALKYLSAYFDANSTETSPYEEDPRDIRSLSFSANGDVLDGNVYQTDILDIIRTYKVTE